VLLGSGRSGFARKSGSSGCDAVPNENSEPPPDKAAEIDAEITADRAAVRAAMRVYAKRGPKKKREAT
jgi:hypothetical protein